MPEVPSLTLFHFPASLCSQKVRLALSEKRAEYSARMVDIGSRLENYEPWYARKNPRMVVPTLEVERGGETEIVTDSARILAWIEAELDGPALLPDEPEARNRAEQWLRRGDGIVVRELTYATMPGLLGVLARKGMARREARIEAELARARAATPELVPAYEARLADIKQWRAAMAEPGLVERREAELAEALGELESQLSGSGTPRPFVVGDRYSLADLMWTVLVARVHLLRRSHLLGPRTQAWFAAMRERPSYAEAGIVDRMAPHLVARTVAPLVLPWLGIALVVAAIVGLLLWLL